MSFITWLKSLFTPKKDATEITLVYPPTAPKPVALKLPEHKIPTKAQVITFVNSLIEFESPYKLPYVAWRETKGKNRSPELDQMIPANGGHLGDSYCLFGQQDIMRAIERRWLGCKIDLPRGGGTQDFFAHVKPEYKRTEPDDLYIGIYRHGDTWQGHAVQAKGKFTKRPYFPTFEFNTDAKDASKIVRDGQGCGYLSRSVEHMPSSDMRLLGFVDVYAAIIWPKDWVK